MKSITKSGSVSEKTCWSDERPGSLAFWRGFLVKLGVERNWNLGCLLEFAVALEGFEMRLYAP